MYPHHQIIQKQEKSIMPTKNKQMKTKVVTNHRYTGLREAILVGGTGGVSTTALAINSNASGVTSGAFALCPVGLTAAKLAAGVYTSAALNVSTPPLRGLYNKAIDFQMYRVLRAKLVFVGATGSTTSGIITLVGYTSAIDVNFQTSLAQLSGPNTKSFDLASGSAKELSVPIPVDSSWKKVSATLSVPGTAAPFFGGSDSCVTVSSVDDLCFGAVSYIVGSGPVSTYLGTLFVDYDVEFKGVIDSSVNL